VSGILTITRELRVGFSLYWATCTREGAGWRVRWSQAGEVREVFSSNASLTRAISEARVEAGRFETPPVPDTEPVLPDFGDEP
jgi:hypothetical protein